MLLHYGEIIKGSFDEKSLKKKACLHEAHLRQASLTVTMRKSERFKKETETPGRGTKAKGSQPKVTGKDSQTKEQNTRTTLRK